MAEPLSEAVDRLRGKYGAGAVVWGRRFGTAPAPRATRPRRSAP
jgi:hypothetical protein